MLDLVSWSQIAEAVLAQNPYEAKCSCVATSPLQIFVQQADLRSAAVQCRHCFSMFNCFARSLFPASSNLPRWNNGTWARYVLRDTLSSSHCWNIPPTARTLLSEFVFGHVVPCSPIFYFLAAANQSDHLGTAKPESPCSRHRTTPKYVFAPLVCSDSLISSTLTTPVVVLELRPPAALL